ncbi:MAG: Protoheme IX farnesyltransferase [Bacteroidota bacterium]|nr:MAG: Protoheme IX farnesyltransferase [Bacteroidota bacterium]
MSAASSSTKLFLQVIGLFSLVRGINVSVLMLAQLLTSVFIFSSKEIVPTLLDLNLWLIVFATGFSVSGGYIFNAFFDEEKDLINRPEKTLLERHISAKTKLGVYFACSILALLVASYVSFRAVLFFTSYMVAMFLYSSLLKRDLWFGTLTSTLLTVLPFFAITVYFNNFSIEILTHAAYLYTLVSIREFVKDLYNIKGDMVQNYKTFPVVWGERKTKQLISVLIFCALLVVALLRAFFDLNAMGYYFILAAISLLFLWVLLWRVRTTRHMGLLLQFVRLIILLGIISLPLLRLTA